MIEASLIADSTSPAVCAESVNAVLLAMAAAASKAPSGDNLQPWTLRVDAESQCLEVWLEEHVDRSSLNSGQRMSRIACGASIECAVCSAHDYGWTTEVELVDHAQAERRCVARVYLREFNDKDAIGSSQRLIAARTTNRRLYDRAPVSADTLATLNCATPPCDGSSVHWIVERDCIDAFAQLVARADVMLFGEPSMRRAFLKNLRFDLPLNASAECGLPLGALGVSAFERLTLSSLRFTPDWLFNLTPAPRMFARYAGKLIRSSSGLCIVAADSSPHGELRAGRAMFRAWLELTAHGMAVQPMMSCIAMTQAIECGSPELIRALGLKKLRAFAADFRTALATLGIRGSPQFLMRFGYAPAPLCRAGRLPLSKVIRDSGVHYVATTN